MTPYYQDDHVTLYHGDCREVTEWLAADVVVTDPPYGIGLDTDFSSLSGTEAWNKAKGSYAGKKYAPIVGDDVPFNPAFLLDGGRPVAMFGPEHYYQYLPAGGTFHVWDKREALGSNMLADCEMVWTSWPSGPARICRHMWLGYMRKSEVGSHLHPTQKPVAVLHWVLGMTPPGTIADPFAGSGTTLRAAKDLGRRAIGVEIEERYCEIAARRCAQEVLAL